MKRTLFVFLSLIVAVAMVAGCQPAAPAAPAATEAPAAATEAPAAATEAPAAGTEAPAAPADAGVTVAPDSDIVVVSSADIVTMLPIDAANTLDGGIQRMVMDGLVGFTQYKVIACYGLRTQRGSRYNYPA